MRRFLFLEKKFSFCENYSHLLIVWVQSSVSSSFLGFEVQSLKWIKGFIFLPFKFKFKFRSLARISWGFMCWVYRSFLGVGLILDFFVLVLSIPAESLVFIVSVKPPGCWAVVVSWCWWWFYHLLVAVFFVSVRDFVEVIKTSSSIALGVSVSGMSQFRDCLVFSDLKLPFVGGKASGKLQYLVSIAMLIYKLELVDKIWFFLVPVTL